MRICGGPSFRRIPIAWRAGAAPARSRCCWRATRSGGTLARESGVRHADFIVAVEVTAGIAPGAEALIRLASAVDVEWLVPTRTEVVHEFVEATSMVRARRVEWYDALVLRERAVSPNPDAAARLLLAAWHRRGPSERDLRLLRRLEFAGLTINREALVAAAVSSATRLDDVRLTDHLAGHVRADLDRLAPDVLRVPSGREHPLTYRADGGVEVAVKLQEVFGLADTPRLGPRAVPVTFTLLAPNQRPVQVTRDLKSFWERGYPEVRKELRGRYPKHPWPEDPWSAPPTFRVKLRK